MAYRKIISVSLLFMLCLGLTGCFNSETDYQQLVEEVESRKVELEAAEKENEILKEAFQSIKKEREILQIKVNNVRSNLNVDASLRPPSTAPLQPDDTISWGGWEWAVPPGSSSTESGQAPGSPTQASGGGRTYQPKAGDVLSTIAARHDTTVAELIRLNPYLENRRNYMIWENDVIRLP